MIRRILPCLALALALAAAAAAPAAAITISGRVLKGSPPVGAPGVPVAAHVLRGNEEMPGKTAITDAQGAFRFTGLPDGAGLEYYVSTEYEGAFYTEGPIAASPSGAATQNLLVYDVGKDFDAVHVQDHHIIVERKEDGLHVTEIMVFQNGAPTAYLGVGVNHAAPSGMRIGLPASVKDFKPGMGLDEGTARLQGRELTSARPIPPGQRPVSFTYTVPLSGRMDLSHRVYFPTHQFTILIDDPSLRLESAQLKSEGTRDQGGKTYALYVGKDVPVGSEVSIRVGGAGFFSNPKVYPFLIAPFVIAAVLLYASKRGARGLTAKRAGERLTLAGAPGAAEAGATARMDGGSATSPSMPIPPAAGRPAAAPKPHAKGGFSAASPQGDDLAQVYLYLIAALDQGAERGEYSQESHALVRGNLKRRLEVILSSEGLPAKSR